jgi:HTH-type transcriptional regulator/antitoxin HigA
MKPNALKTETEDETALARIETLIEAEPNSSQEEELKRLVVLVEEYELEHYPIAAPDPIEAMKFRMEQQGSTQKLSTGR